MRSRWMQGSANSMPVARANDVDFFFEEWGNGPSLVLLHGFTGSSESWSDVGGELAKDRRVIAIDLIGHGRSSAPRDVSHYAFERAVNDLAAIADQLGLGRATWLGYSMGGRLALGLALRHPGRVSSLILESASPGIQDEADRLRRIEADETLAQSIEDGGVEVFVGEWERLPMWENQRSLPHEVLAHQRALRLRNSAVGLANSLRGMGQGSQPSYWDRLGEIDVPVFLIAGSLDRKYAGIAGQMGVRIQEASLSVVPQAGHAVHLEQPEQFAASIRDFLAGGDRVDTSERQEKFQWT